MVRTAFADDNFLKYLDSFGKLDFPTVGLMLGQPIDAKDYIIHFTRTPPYRGDGEKSPKKFLDLPDAWIADHARHVTRMLPGGMYVLGLFVVCQEDVFGTCASKLKTILGQIHKKLNVNPFLYSIPKGFEELVLHYVPSSRHVCKSYNYDTCSLSNSEIKFQSNLPVNWLQIECKYELDQIFPIAAEKANWPLKKHVNEILSLINSNLEGAVYFYDGEIKNDGDHLDPISKKQKSHLGLTPQTEDDNKLMQVTIVLPIADTSDSEVEILHSGGQIRLAGHVASKVWLHPKATVRFASQSIKQDIVRSLAARLEMHWDSLIEEEHGSPEDTNSMHETPRRVLVNLPTTKVTLSDYLFPGEGSQEAQISLSELLDIKISEPGAIFDVEGQPDIPELTPEVTEADYEDILPNTTNKKIYIVGLGFAFAVLVISLFIHFIKG